jgi:hypothetical protein
MRRLVYLVVALVALSAPAAAESDFYRDWRSGNTYNIERDDDGTVTVYGRNYNTGSRWRNVIEPDGDQRGVDSNGNRWRYNSTTGRYQNSDGSGCIGHGLRRTCW